MGQLRSFLTQRHRSAPRNYAERAAGNKPELASIAKKFDFHYWDAGRETGYGGYIDDGRWASVAKEFCISYELKANSSILDFGCGKGFFLNELKKLYPQAALQGIDISRYAIEGAPTSIRDSLKIGGVEELPSIGTGSCELVAAMNVLHNLELPELLVALRQIQRISGGRAYVCVESYRNEQEKWNLMRWQLTCESFFSPEAWRWIFAQAEYTGDFEFIFFE